MWCHSGPEPLSSYWMLECNMNWLSHRLREATQVLEHMISETKLQIWRGKKQRYDYWWWKKLQQHRFTWHCLVFISFSPFLRQVEIKGQRVAESKVLNFSQEIISTACTDGVIGKFENGWRKKPPSEGFAGCWTEGCWAISSFTNLHMTKNKWWRLWKSAKSDCLSTWNSKEGISWLFSSITENITRR